ncbi:MAG: flagellar basal-body rod modification protein FlgD [Pseudonocardiales bacterium]|jgi:flagellar basal-body rod modification protein FlgD|nr:flagellar basal-body rod modification protein FlgD [Pseudonocardiales bacterium]
MTQPVSSVATGLPVAPNPAIESGDNTKLSSKAFLQLLVAQLQYQDPSKPVDTSSFMNETATLTQVQSSEQTAQVSLDMLSAQRAQTASSLVGHTVSYTGTDGALVTGYVSAATISTAKPTLKIGTVDVDLSQIQQVLATGTP